MGKTLALNTSLRLGHQPSDYNFIIREVQAWKRLAWPWSKSSLDSFPMFEKSWRVEDLQRLQFKSYAWLTSRFLDAVFIVNFYEGDLQLISHFFTPPSKLFENVAEHSRNNTPLFPIISATHRKRLS
jgi:hypothetical protein